MQKVLIIHHLEEIWESGYENAGYELNEVFKMFLEHLEKEEYDQIILTQSQNRQPQEKHREYFPKFDPTQGFHSIANYVTQWEVYGYGWKIKEDDIEEWLTEGVFISDKSKYAVSGGHSQYVYLPDWMGQLKGYNVYIAGAFDEECIEDLETALSFLNVKYSRINQLII